MRSGPLSLSNSSTFPFPETGMLNFWRFRGTNRSAKIQLCCDLLISCDLQFPQDLWSPIPLIPRFSAKYSQRSYDLTRVAANCPSHPTKGNNISQTTVQHKRPLPLIITGPNRRNSIFIRFGKESETFGFPRSFGAARH